MKLTDSDVEMIRELHEVHRLSYAKLAVKFEVSLSAINKICRYVRRTGQRQTANAFR
jgi:DNA-directed RNA polymerase specialized sigma24 family protein